MLTTSALFRRALPFPHRRETSIKVFHSGVDVTPPEGIPFTGGSVQANLSSRVTRRATLDIDGDEFFPTMPSDTLSPYRAVVQISSGIGYPDGSFETFPIFTGRVRQASLSPGGTTTIECDDLAADVVAFRFETPQASEIGSSIIAEMQRLILQAVPGATFGTHDVEDRIVPHLVWDEDRGQALDDLASALSGRWYTLGNGDFVFRKLPYVGGVPALTITDGEPVDTIGSGLLSEATRTITREGMANSIVVVSERLEADSPPIRVIKRDTNPASPTFFGPMFGFVTQILNPQTPTNFLAAQELAVQQLAASTALSDQWSVGMIPDHSLEPGDTVRFKYRHQDSVQVIDTIDYPIVTDGLMNIASRASVPDTGELS